MAVFFARMVIPRSFSKSLESITRSVASTRSPKVPDCWSNLSTKVVLPWSTWAIMAMLRKFSITALPQALEIARYCTRIKRGSKQDHKDLIETTQRWLLCDPFHGAKRPSDTHDAPFWCLTSHRKHQKSANFPLWCILVRCKSPLKWRCLHFLKVGTDFAITFAG